MHDRHVRALVSLHGGIGTPTGIASMTVSPSLALRRLRANVLHFYETQDAFMTPDFTLLADVRGDGDPGALTADFPAIDGRVTASPFAGSPAFQLTVLRRPGQRSSAPAPP